MLGRIGTILGEAVSPPAHACRTGGDEFAILMPRTDAAHASALLERIEALIDRENALHPGTALEIAAGIGTAQDGDRVEDAVRRADARMYEAKALFYLDPARCFRG
jgi:diguanylate cyclase (GGDEF)-like protein